MLVCLLSSAITHLSCQKKQEEVAASSVGRYLYVATGLCYSGNGNTTFTATSASNLVLKINTDSGIREQIVADYNASPASTGDTPVGVVDWDDSNLLVLVANGTSGRIETVPKHLGTRLPFGLNPSPATVIATAPRGMVKTPDGGLLILRTGFIEKVSKSGIRQGSPWVNNNLGATCGTANTFFTSVLTSSTSKIIATHAAAAGYNRTVFLPATGANGSCTAALSPTAPLNTSTFPVAAVFDTKNSKILIAYAMNVTTAGANVIVSYDYNDSTGLSNPQVIYDVSAYPATYSYVLYGISAMALDETTNSLYVATAISTTTTVSNYSIEKFTYDPTQIGTANSSVLTRVGSTPFYNYGVDTKCISQMVVGD